MYEGRWHRSREPRVVTSYRRDINNYDGEDTRITLSRMSTMNKKNIYNIVHFYKSTTYKGKKSMDCVPSTWIVFDPDNQELVVKFMPPPYTKKKCNVLHEMVKNNKNVMEHWPQYPIKILESAETYTEALSKMENLIEEDFNYTTDYCTTDVEDNEDNIKKKVIKGESPILPVYGLNDELSKHTVSSSDDNDSNTENMSDIYEPLNKKSIVPKKEKLKQNNSNKKSSSDVSTANMSSSSKKPTVVEHIVLKNPSTENITVTKYLKQIVTDLQDLKNNQGLMQKDLQTLKTSFEQKMIEKIGENVPIHWTQENQIKWPLETKEEYDKLNSLLLADEKIRNDFMATIGFVIDGGTVVSKNLLAVFRKFFHKDLVTKFTCVKPMKDKFTLKPSALYNCIIEVFMRKSEKGAIPETITEKLLEKLIGAILTNSRDWEKGRLQRKTVKQTKDKENVNNDNDLS